MWNVGNKLSFPMPPRSTVKTKSSSNPSGWFVTESDLILGAAQKNRPMELLRLIKVDGISPNHANHAGQTALHIAAMWGHVDCVALLVSKDIGANPNATNRLTRATPLHMAIQGNKIREGTRLNLVIDVLLQAGADKDLADSFGRLPIDYISHKTPDPELFWHKLQPSIPPIFQAIRSGNFVQVLALFYSGVQSPDQLACQVHCNCTTVQAVVDLLVSIVDPFAPLDTTMLADFDLFQILLACGASASPAAPSKSTYEAMDVDDDDEFSGDMISPPIIRLLDCIQKALSGIVERKDIGVTSASLSLPPIVQLWLQACQALQDRNEQDYAMGLQSKPLLTTEEVARYWHNAARRGHLLLLRALYNYLPLLFEVNAVNRQGMTALHFAARSGQTHVVSYLLSLPQTDISLKDHCGKTALDAAMVNGHMNVVEVFRSWYASTRREPDKQ